MRGHSSTDHELFHQRFLMTVKLWTVRSLDTDTDVTVVSLTVSIKSETRAVCYDKAIAMSPNRLGREMTFHTSYDVNDRVVKGYC